MAAPVVSSIAPTSGPTGGGTIVTITGTGFTGAIAVGFGSADATNIAVASDTQVIAVTPAGSSVANVTVVTAGGRSAINPAALFSFSAPAATGGATPYYIDPALTSTIVGSLVNVLSAQTSPDALEAQNILMRRLALEGDVVGSRVPPPRNITEIGGYLNILGELKEGAMREQTLAGILGVAGPLQAQGFISNATPLSMVALPNDRPAGAAQPSIPTSAYVRSDFVSAVQAALKTLHAAGATLPLIGPSVITLPKGGPGAAVPANVLAYLGRTLNIAPQTALAAPGTDPIALIRASGTTDLFAAAANAINPATTPVTPANYDALQCTATTKATVPLAAASFVPLAPVLGAAGFYQASPPPQPANATDLAWATFGNVTGLVAGETLLGDELTLLHRPDAIAASVFASLLNAVWNGATFV
ncbi:IPT/TIG domain-containing protein [Phenylobacterium sp.]|uniref:IPT/TIG domain-containing protein n=1 Tax=Phenylobacterium sp. TaxID=1871053 RepID=UPI00356775E6